MGKLIKKACAFHGRHNDCAAFNSYCVNGCKLGASYIEQHELAMNNLKEDN